MLKRIKALIDIARRLQVGPWGNLVRETFLHRSFAVRMDKEGHFIKRGFGGISGISRMGRLPENVENDERDDESKD